MRPLGPFLSFLLLLSPLPAEEKRNAAEARPLVIDWLSNSRNFESLEIDFTQERQLKTLRQPLSRQGKLYLTQTGHLRWQIDSPPSLLLLRNGPDAPLLWLDLKKQTQETLNPENDRTQGNAQAMQFLLQSQTTTIEAFEQAFTLKNARPVADAPGQWRLELDINDRRAALAVKDVFFHIEPATGALHLMEFQLRDGSLLRTRITRAVKNPALPKNLFSPP